MVKTVSLFGIYTVVWSMPFRIVQLHISARPLRASINHSRPLPCILPSIVHTRTAMCLYSSYAQLAIPYTSFFTASIANGAIMGQISLYPRRSLGVQNLIRTQVQQNGTDDDLLYGKGSFCFRSLELRSTECWWCYRKSVGVGHDIRSNHLRPPNMFAILRG